MEQKDIRWIQRFSNFKKALAKLSEAAAIQKRSELEQEGLIQRFEYTYELAWKTLQDLLHDIGYNDIAGPTPVLTQALEDGYIKDRKGWQKMKKSRELTSHTYDSETAEEIAEDIIDTYIFLFNDLKERLEAEQQGLNQLPLFE
jgi:nucleotidyltransferase substrate binding protein (TIGR01987 family)